MLRRPMYVWYDNTGQVITISNIRSDTDNSYEIDFDLVENLLDYRDTISKYNIEHFHNLVNGIPIPEIEVELDNTELNFYLVPVTNGLNNEVTFVHDCVNRQWSVNVRKDKLDKAMLIKEINFAVCEKDNPSFLYSTYCVKSTDLSKAIPFKTANEVDFSKVGIVTKNVFRSYGIREIK